MNSNYGKSKGSTFDFDFNLGSNFSSNQSKPLRDQKQQTPNPTSWSHQPNKQSYTHQPIPSQPARSAVSNPVSMVGDISGKSWNSAPPSKSNVGLSLGIGIVEKNPNLFSDLVSSALGQGKSGSSNVPLKSAPPLASQTGETGSKNSFSMGNLGNSLPKRGSWGSSESIGSYSSSKIGNLGGPSLKSGGLGSGSSQAAKKDPFGSLVDMASKKEANVKMSGSGGSGGNSSGEYSFGDFQNAGKSSTQSFPSTKSPANNNNNSMGSNSKMDSFGDFDIPIQKTTSQKPTQSSGVDPLDMLFSSSTASGSAAPIGSGATGSQPFSEMDDWGMESDFSGEAAGGTTELDGLPPPPAGVTASVAKSRGLDNYKQGQHPDAIKWLTWAVVLLEKAGDDATTVEVLSCRASCYKEVGEYKKAIADCTKVLEQDVDNVSVLVQRALLYESTEKYKLGAEDLRTVLKIDPGNRLAKSTIHRLIQMSD